MNRFNVIQRFGKDLVVLFIFSVFRLPPLNVVGRWKSARIVYGVRNVLKVSDLKKSVKDEDTRRSCVANMKL